MSLTIERLRQLIKYDPETGMFIRAADTHGGRWKAGSVVGCRAERQGRMYLRICIDRRFYYAHRLAWLWVYGDYGPQDIDHINGDGTDNRIANLRAATHAENMCNRGKNRNNTSGYKGVWWSKKDSVWRADIWTRGLKISLGRFDSKEEAARAYAVAADRYHGQFARTH